MFKRTAIAFCLLFGLHAATAQPVRILQEAPHYRVENALTDVPYSGTIKLTRAGAEHLASLALKCIGQEFPNKPGHVQTSGSDLFLPSEYHPAFYGCYDWHSSVHGHWMLVKLLGEFPDMHLTPQIRSAVNLHLTAEKIAVEAFYFGKKENRSFERTYGWAWLLKLQEELLRSDDPDCRRWAANVQPLADTIVSLYMNYLPRLTYPIRVGMHNNTAFGLSLALDYARTTGNRAFETLIVQRATDYFGNDRKAPWWWEPNGTDFLSPALTEVELMSKVLGKQKFLAWVNGFLHDEPQTLLEPATVSDRSDPQLVHLDGLNLSRAWCWKALARKVETEGFRNQLNNIANKHLDAALPHIASGGYEGEHWLASFAVYALFY